MYFFYDSVEIARDAERKIEELAEQLKKTATDIGANDHTHAVGITLMKNIFEHFGGELSPLSHPPMGRVLASFERCWLSGATGRGAEPSM